jgi:intracellular septation protein
MKFLFDLFPVILFFAAFKLANIYVATAAAIGATLLQVALLAALRRKIDTMLWVSLGIIVVFGGATLVLHDETFIKWKPTVLYWLFAAVLAGADLLFRRNLIRAMLGEQLQVPDPVWARLNWSWVVFFALMGAANLYVAFAFAENFCTNVAESMARNLCENNVWVNFKLFGATGLMLLFVIGQALFLARHVPEEKPQEDKP